MEPEETLLAVPAHLVATAARALRYAIGGLANHTHPEVLAEVERMKTVLALLARAQPIAPPTP